MNGIVIKTFCCNRFKLFIVTKVVPKQFITFVFYYREHAEKAIKIIRHILPPDHLLLASSNRVIGRYTMCVIL